MKRRHFLEQSLFAAGGVLTPPASRLLQAGTQDPPAYTGSILDTHIHLFDPTRPGGIPWPLADDLIYKPALPARYEALAKPLGVVGAIAIEASPLASDNDWLLRIVEASPVMVGMIGDLNPTAPNFSSELDRLHRNALYLGIRHGNLWNRSLSEDVIKPLFWGAMRHLSQAGLVLESANPDLPLLEAIAEVAERMPDLTVVIDHLPNMKEPASVDGRKRFSDLLAQLGKAPRTFAKLSEVPRQVEGKPVMELAIYRARLDQLWESFGAEKLVFGSDWPNSDHIAPLPETLNLVRHYLATKDEASQQRFFYSNSKTIYNWRSRQDSQTFVRHQLRRKMPSPTSQTV